MGNLLLWRRAEHARQMAREGEQCPHADEKGIATLVAPGRLRGGSAKIGGGPPDRAPPPVRERDHDESRPAARAHRKQRKPLAGERMTRIRHRHMRDGRIDDDGRMRCSVTPR